MINKVILVGRLGQDPEIKATQNGKLLANMSVATSASWKDKSTGDRKEKTEWNRVVVFNEGLVNVIQNYVKKGTLIYLEGQLQTRKWRDQSGADRYSTEVVLQGFGSSLQILDGKQEQGNVGTQYDAGTLEDEIPF